MIDLSKVIVIDVETSGLDPARHGILQIGAARLGSDEEFELRVRLRPDLEWDPKAAEVHGFTEEDCRSIRYPGEAEALTQLFDIFGWGEFVLAGQNPHFDLAMLRAVTNRTPSRAWPRLRSRVLDMHSVALAWACVRGIAIDPLTLDSGAIYRMLGMEEEPRPHQALAGARMERAALLKMLEPEETFTCECGDIVPMRFYAAEAEGVSLCPDCMRSLQEEELAVLCKVIRGEVLAPEEAVTLEASMRPD